MVDLQEISFFITELRYSDSFCMGNAKDLIKLRSSGLEENILPACNSFFYLLS